MKSLGKFALSVGMWVESSNLLQAEKDPGTDQQSLLLHNKGNGTLLNSSPGMRGFHVRKEEDWSLLPTAAPLHKTCSTSQQESTGEVHSPSWWKMPVPRLNEALSEPDLQHISGPHTALLRLEPEHSAALVLERTRGCTADRKGSGLPASFTLSSKTTFISESQQPALQEPKGQTTLCIQQHSPQQSVGDGIWGSAAIKVLSN